MACGLSDQRKITSNLPLLVINGSILREIAVFPG